MYSLNANQTVAFLGSLLRGMSQCMKSGKTNTNNSNAIYISMYQIDNLCTQRSNNFTYPSVFVSRDIDALEMRHKLVNVVFQLGADTNATSNIEQEVMAQENLFELEDLCVSRLSPYHLCTHNHNKNCWASDRKKQMGKKQMETYNKVLILISEIGILYFYSHCVPYENCKVN